MFLYRLGYVFFSVLRISLGNLLFPFLLYRLHSTQLSLLKHLYDFIYLSSFVLIYQYYRQTNYFLNSTQGSEKAFYKTYGNSTALTVALSYCDATGGWLNIWVPALSICWACSTWLVALQCQIVILL